MIWIIICGQSHFVQVEFLNCIETYQVEVFLSLFFFKIVLSEILLS